MTVLGADISCAGNSHLIDVAGQVLTKPPAFFGRYFKKPGNTDPVQYQSASENAIFGKTGIRILCIGRQTNHVNGSGALGVSDAADNINAIMAAFGPQYLKNLGMAPIVFLDTEPQNPMSAEYYSSWASTLTNPPAGIDTAGLSFTPAIYLNKSDDTTWKALQRAIGGGAPCAGAWVARYVGIGNGLALYDSAAF